MLLDAQIQRQIRKRAAKAGVDAHQVLVAAGTPCRVVEYMVPNRGGATETFA